MGMDEKYELILFDNPIAAIIWISLIFVAIPVGLSLIWWPLGVLYGVIGSLWYLIDETLSHY